ncbi:PadR family transcriptional regulator [Catenulispora pinisilvae]|uniref:PadR family transcriptional regulator n=1 Tax=Catenulispora pinisilvae TaxID=2705253 RepID=UPI001E44FEDF|nr:PadR family transcriptional regulator [Catenulispora pinisilvae]
MASKSSDPMPRMTQATLAVLRALSENPIEPMYGLQISGAAGLPSGTIHPILARLEAASWLESSWEDIDPVAEGRPRRRYYRLSPAGAARAHHALDRADAAVAALRLRPAAGGAA